MARIPLGGWPETLTRKEAEEALARQRRRVPAVEARGMAGATARAGVLLAAAKAKAERGEAPPPFGADRRGIILYEQIRREGDKVVVDLEAAGKVEIDVAPQPGAVERAVHLRREGDGWHAEVLLVPEERDVRAGPR